MKKKILLGVSAFAMVMGLGVTAMAQDSSCTASNIGDTKEITQNNWYEDDSWLKQLSGDASAAAESTDFNIKWVVGCGESSSCDQLLGNNCQTENNGCENDDNSCIEDDNNCAGNDCGSDNKPDINKPENGGDSNNGGNEGENGGDINDSNENDNAGILSSEAKEVLNIVNSERASAGLSALSANSKATAAANIRAKEISEVFSHTRPNGTSCFTALDETGVSQLTRGENIAKGQKTASEVMNSWMNSSGHKANILSGNFKEIGIGVYKDSSGSLNWVQMFIG